MKVSHGVFMIDGKPTNNRKVWVRFDEKDPLFLQIVDMVKAEIEKEGGRARTLRHIEVEVKFGQEDVDMYRPESMKLEGVWGP